MTIIHNYSLKQRKQREIRYYFNEFTNQFGHAKAIFLSGALIILFITLWLVIFTSNISLDYQISSFKKQIQNKNDSISSLYEQVSSTISDKKLAEWAQDNGFTNITSLTYLNLSDGNLAQADRNNFK